MRTLLLLTSLLGASLALAAPDDTDDRQPPGASVSAAPNPAVPAAGPAGLDPAADTDLGDPLATGATDTDTDPQADTDTPGVAPAAPALEYVWMGPPLPSMWLQDPVEPADTYAPDTDAPDTDAPDTDAHAADAHAADAHGTEHTDGLHDTDAHAGHDAVDTDTPAHAGDSHSSAGHDDAAGDTDATGPVAAHDAPPALEPPDALSGWRSLVPELRLRGWRWAFGLALLTLLMWAGARGLDPVRELLAPTGVLPSLATAAQQVLRLLALSFGLGVVAAVVPGDIAPALPFIVVAAAIAIGWSARDVMPDLLAGMVIATERRIRPDRWIATREVAGVVEQIALRVTWVRDATGRRVAIPNRTLLREAVVTDRGRWPIVELSVRVPEGHPPSEVRRVVEDAILVSPWAAPVPAEMVNEQAEPGRWRVRARVLEGRFADRFEGALREHVEEVLARGNRRWN